MRDPPVTASFKDIHKADEIAVHICVRIFKAVAHTRLGSKMDDSVESVIGEEVSHALSVRQIQANEGKGIEWFQQGETCFFEPYIIVAVQIVKTYDIIPVIEKTSA